MIGDVFVLYVLFFWSWFGLGIIAWLDNRRRFGNEDWGIKMLISSLVLSPVALIINFMD